MESPNDNVLLKQITAKQFKEASRLPNPNKEETDSLDSIELTPPDSPEHVPAQLTPEQFAALCQQNGVINPFVRPEPKSYDAVSFYYNLTPKQQLYLKLAAAGIAQGIVIGIGAYYGRQAVGAAVSTVYGVFSGLMRKEAPKADVSRGMLKEDAEESD